MPRFEVRQSAKLNLTSYSGVALIGQCCEAAQVDAVVDPRLPVSQSMKTSDMVIDPKRTKLTFSYPLPLDGGGLGWG